MLIPSNRAASLVVMPQSGGSLIDSLTFTLRRGGSGKIIPG
ncbi:hypothetical protein QET40_06790 [Akkermansia sp. N21169]|nr:hypothetical protein [Akkermansia sp. N21169]MDH3068821.1 hypothetical protein [Akkermansia sp. N21169]